jgi:hypothetical protein
MKEGYDLLTITVSLLTRLIIGKFYFDDLVKIGDSISYI